jgi:hypothetical protein
MVLAFISYLMTLSRPNSLHGVPWLSIVKDMECEVLAYFAVLYQCLSAGTENYLMYVFAYSLYRVFRLKIETKPVQCKVRVANCYVSAFLDLKCMANNTVVNCAKSCDS